MTSVSFVITTYNRAEYLRESVASIRAQNIKDVEIIVVDDASTGGALEALTGDPAFSGVVFLRHTENRGPGEGRNTGISAANGKYIAFLDDDDLLDPRFLETALDVMARDPSIALFCCDAILIDSAGSVLYGGRTFHEINAAIKRYPIRSGFRSPEEIFMFSTIGIGFVVGRQVFDRVSYPVARRMEDYEFQLRVAASGLKVYYHHEPLARYRMHEGNASGPRRRVNMCQRNVEFLQEALDRYPRLRRLRWRARRRIADARMELGIAYLKEGAYQRGVATLFRSVADDPRQTADQAGLVWRWLAKRAWGGSSGSIEGDLPSH